jgi:hypothetical protein
MDDYYNEANRNKDTYTITWMREAGTDWWENDAMAQGKYGGGPDPKRVPSEDK